MTGQGLRGPGPAGRPWSARLVVPPEPRTPYAARRVVSALLIAWGFADQVELAELVTSELTSNAVRHAGAHGDLELELSADEELIKIMVADGSAERPVLRPTGHNGGLGLQLVDRVAIRWGVEDYLLGKRVWVHLPSRPGPGRASDGVPPVAPAALAVTEPAPPTVDSASTPSTPR